MQNRVHVNDVVAKWMSERSLEEVIATTREGGVPCAQIYSIREIFEDEQYKARENLLHIHDPRVGELVVPAPLPRLSETPPTFKHAGRSLGADNGDVYSSLLSMSPEMLDALKRAGVI